MRCSKCGSDNPDGKKFCEDCGAPLATPCPRCGAETTAGKRFCGECGTPLDATVQATEAREGGLTGERRHLTVLFCDLVGSTEIAAQLDPEEWRELIGSYHRAAAEAITQYGGHVAQYLGDGVMAYFGWPEAHGNNAERAARAGLAIIDAISKLNEHLAQPKLLARVGIDSGAVVVGAGASTRADVFGDTPNVAARVQAAARPGTVLMTAATHRLISGLFIVEDCHARVLKGIDRLVQLYRVVRPSGVRGRLEAAAASRGLTWFVGREEELSLLMNRWKRAREGEGCAVLIVGEAGIGKSRLVHRFHKQIAKTPHIWVEASASPFFQNTPFHSIVEVLRQLAWGGNVVRFGDRGGQSQTDEQTRRNDGSRGELTPSERLAQFEAGLTDAGLDPAEALPLLAPMLGLPLPARYSPSALTPEQQRRRLLSVIVEWVLDTARLQTLVIVTEDLHWADPSTLELMQLLLEKGSNSRLMLLYTARPEFNPEWPLRTHQVQIALNPLSAKHAHAMVAEMTAPKSLADETVAAVVERTAGVPLFIEELTLALLEGSEVKPGGVIPTTLHDSLLARLDALGAAREVAQVGAVIGPEFSYKLLQAVLSMPEDNLQGLLRSLGNAELVYVRGQPPDATYQFKHALIRDAAYEALLKSKRRELHTRIARQLIERFPEQRDSHPEILAYHCIEAGLTAQACRYLRRAGQKAVERSANAEAIVHLVKGLELLTKLTATSDNRREEMRLQSNLINPLIATKGYTAPEVERACIRAMELCREFGDPSQLFRISLGLFAFYHNSGKFRKASETAEQMLRWAEATGDAGLMMWSYYILGTNSEAQGDLPTARAHLERSLGLHGSGQRSSYGAVQDPYLSGSALLAHVLHALGYPDQALEKVRQSLSGARALNEPYTLAWIMGVTANLYLRRGEHLKARDLATERIALCAHYGFSSLSAQGHLHYGWALVQEGHGDEGIARLLHGLAMVTTIHRHVFELYLAAAYRQMSWVSEGLAIVENALAEMSDESEAYNSLPDLFRLKGELLSMHHSREIEAGECLQRAIKIAWKNGDKAAELQATTSLARLLAKQERRVDARAMLAEIYNWFTEGFDTADLKDAKALLDELSV